MIIDSLEHLECYHTLLPNLANALKALDEHKNSWGTGVKYPFEGGFLFFQEGVTKPLVDSQFESHRRHIDVQVLLRGAEYVALEDLSKLSTIIPYSDERDVEKYQGETKHMMKISAGMVYVCFPWDGHKAVFHIDEPLEYQKAVIKLEINK
ncbi:YhcH/YjgK/YiaL family protein [Streptococcus massiliensis]|uniref:Beta-galactosidase subunit beta n=1 Tax=Streptococcus massiliensis TaxID=313439 RepID=A0A380KYM4_9STRE|nr:YhcH/YjgK/YiaL family protein [Streptococcus massiliensis]SUN76036.1 beta-galactosidase subunit beta [Streptococcus massiliensis]